MWYTSLLYVYSNRIRFNRNIRYLTTGTIMPNNHLTKRHYTGVVSFTYMNILHKNCFIFITKRYYTPMVIKL